MLLTKSLEKKTTQCLESLTPSSQNSGTLISDLNLRPGSPVLQNARVPKKEPLNKAKHRDWLLSMLWPCSVLEKKRL